MRYIYNGKPLYHSVEGLQHLEPAPEQVDLDKHKYGLPKLKKYPMPDAAHVKSAIKFFNYVSPKDEKALANAILDRMREYGMTGIKVGEDNRFSKYYHPDSLQHSSGIWQEHDYQDKIELPDGSFRYVYPDTDSSAIGSRLNGSNAPKDNQGISSSPKSTSTPTHKQAVQQQKSLDNFKNTPVSELKGNNANIHSNNHGIVGTDKKETNSKDTNSKDTDSKDTNKKTTTTDDKKNKKGKGGSGKKGSGSKKSGKSGKSGSGKKGSGSKKSGKSGKSGSGKKGSSGKSSDADSKKAAKEAKKQQKAQKDYQKELQKMKEENQRKQDEQFKKRKQENEKRWAADQERYEKMRDTSRESVSKETLNEIIDMLKDSDKEYAKKLLEGGRSKIDDYLDWIKESRKNNN